MLHSPVKESGFREGIGERIINNELYEAFIKMLWYQGYDVSISKMIEKIKETDTYISYDEKNGFSEEVWSVFVLMFGDYGSSPRYGWIEKVKDFKTFLENISLKLEPYSAIRFE